MAAYEPRKLQHASSIDLKKLFVKRVSTVILIEQMTKWMSRQKLAEDDEQTASRGDSGPSVV